MTTSMDNGWMRRSFLVLALALTPLAACGGDDDDGSEKGDTGVKDAAVKDGSVADAKIDASEPEVDSGTPVDSAVSDAKVTDSAIDARVSGDSGSGDSGSAEIPTFNGCAAADYVDRSAGGATREVTFGGDFKYTPKCLIIAAGQSVTLKGTFSNHPLAKGTPADGSAGSANSPITPTNDGTTKTFAFPTAGTYPYYCTAHAGVGMIGSIHVK